MKLDERNKKSNKNKQGKKKLNTKRTLKLILHNVKILGEIHTKLKKW